MQDDGRTPRWELMFDGLKVMEFASRGELVDFLMQGTSALRW